MSAPKIRGHYGELATIAKTFVAQAGNTQQTIQSIKQAVELLRSGDWVGQGATTFYQEMDGAVLPALQRLQRSFLEAGQVTLSISTLIQEAEIAAAKLFVLKDEGAYTYANGFASEAPAPARDTHSSPPPVPAPTPDATGTPTPTPTPAGPPAQSNKNYKIDTVDLPEFTAFLSQWTGDLYDNSHGETRAILQKYLNTPELAAIQQEVIRGLVTRVQNGEAPLTPEEFYNFVRTYVDDPGTALLVCHNITKEMARPAAATLNDPSSLSAATPIAWARDPNPPPGKVVYTMNGERFEIDITSPHPNAVTTYHGNNSAFYMMFSANSLGTTDAGDWYHYYVTATTAYYGASGRMTGMIGAGTDYVSGLGMVMRSVSNHQSDILPSLFGGDGYTGWRMANALSFLEGGFYGDTDAEVLRESQIHRQGALFGLQTAGITPGDDWSWHVAKAKSLSSNSAQDSYFDVVFGLGDDTQVVLPPQ